MQLGDAINRGKNLLTVSILSIAGIGFLPEFFVETEWRHKVDDGLLFVLGVIAVFWYLNADNKFKRSAIPVVLLILGLVVKIFGLIVEMGDASDVGDDFGGLLLFVAAVILVLWQFWKREEA